MIKMTGVVLSTKTPKTVIVAVVSTYRHPLYKKVARKTKYFAAYNESMTLSVGDKVIIGETRPITKTKHFKVLEKLV